MRYFTAGSLNSTRFRVEEAGRAERFSRENIACIWTRGARQGPGYNTIEWRWAYRLQVRRAYEAVKRLDPFHPVSLSLNCMRSAPACPAAPRTLSRPALR